MMRRPIALLVVLLMVFGPLVQGVDIQQEKSIEPMDPDVVEPPASIVQPDARELLSNIDGFFTENLGQKGEGAGRFYCEGAPLSVAFANGGVSYDYRPERSDQGVMFRVLFEGANPVEPVGLDPLPHKSNFFLGDDPDKWHTDVGNHGRILFPGIYDNIDLEFFIQETKLKYEFIVGIGGDPSAICMSFEGVRGLEIDPENGDLIIETDVGPLRDEAPKAYQMEGKDPIELRCTFNALDEMKVGFILEDYRKDHPLIIDPGLEFSTYLGGSNMEDPHGALFVDEDGHVYIVGPTSSSDFPTTPGAYDTTKDPGSGDGFVTKMEADGGNLSYSTYIGGTQNDGLWDIVVDPSGNAYIAGGTLSTDFPTTLGAYNTTSNGGNDGIVVVLNATGSSLLASSFYGGSSSEGFSCIDLDAKGNIMVSGTTHSSDLPKGSGGYDTTYNGLSDIMYVKMDSRAGRLLDFTYLGGSDYDEIGRMVVGNDNCPILVGRTSWTNDYPTTPGAYQGSNKGNDVVVTKLNENATQLVFSTFLGGTNVDKPDGLDIDENNNIYILGSTQSSNFPTTANAYDSTLSGRYDVFIVRMSSDGDTLEFGSYLGGSSDDLARGQIQVIQEDVVSFSIGTSSNDMDTTLDAYDDTYNGGSDCYIGIMNTSSGHLVYGTFIGGSSVDRPIDIQNRDWEITVIGHTESNDFPTTPGAFDTTYSSGEKFVLRIVILPVNATVPSPPLNVSVTEGDRSVHLTWDPPDDTSKIKLRGYNIYRGLTSDNLTLARPIPPDPPRCTDRPPVLGRPLYYSVTAFNLKGEGNLSEVVSVIPYGSPLAPKLHTTAGCGTVHLDWTPPDDTGGHPILGYKLVRGTATTQMELVVELGNETEYIDVDRTNGIMYSYKVRAFNLVGDGDNSSIALAMPVGPPSRPQLTSLVPGDERIDITWDPPANNNGRPVLGYRLLRGVDGGGLEEHATFDARTSSHIDNGLTNGLTYSYCIIAWNEVGDSPRSPVVSEVPVGLPGVPLDFYVESGDGMVSLYWSAPEFDGGTSIIRYHVLKGSTEADIEHHTTMEAGVTFHTDEDLMNGQPLYYAIYAENRIGNGPWTGILVVTPLALPDAPGSLVALAGNSLVTISWLRPMDDGGAEVTQYNIHRGTLEDGLQPIHSRSKSSFIYDDSDVDVGITYYYAVSAVTAAGEGPVSVTASATPYGPPGTPIDLDAIPGNSEVRLTWSAPEDDGASPIEGYVLLRGTTPSNLREIAQLGDVASYLDTGVTNGITYLYIIAAINEAGPGDYTETIPATPVKPTTAPGKVTTLVADAKGAKVTLQWSKPQDDGGSPVTGYVILRGLTKESLEQIVEVGPAVTTWSEDGLERGTTYYYSVAAKNDVGEGEPILAREVKVPKEAESPGFEIFAVMAALLIVVPIVRRRVV